VFIFPADSAQYWR